MCFILLCCIGSIYLVLNNGAVTVNWKEEGREGRKEERSLPKGGTFPLRFDEMKESGEEVNGR